MRRTALLWTSRPALLAAVAAVVGCAASEPEATGDAGTGTDTQGGLDSADAVDAAESGDVSEGSDSTDASDGGPTCDDASAEDFAVVYGQRYRLPGETDFDLYMMRPQRGYPPLKLTDLSLKEEGVTCELGCLVDPDLEWIAVTTEQAPGTGGFTVQFGRFDGCKKVALVKGNKFPNLAHLEFAKDFLYFSEILPGCVGASCQYRITRVDLNKPSDKRVIVEAFPPNDDPDWKHGDSTYGGVFHVSPDGESLVILSPTIRSQRVFLWVSGTLHEVDYLCDNPQNDSCIGAGSRYDDEDPVAISPDSKTIIVFAVNQSALRLRRYSTENPADKSFVSLLNVLQSGGDYEQTACAVREPWQPVKIIGQPAFTPDGKGLLFLGTADCDDNQKVMTNIYRVDPTNLFDQTPIIESEITNLTQNPEGDIPENKEMTGFSITPDGKRILFAATPELGQNYTPITNPKDQRPFGDTEVYMMSICGGPAEQITNDVSYSASSPRAYPMPDPAGCGVYPLPAVP